VGTSGNFRRSEIAYSSGGLSLLSPKIVSKMGNFPNPQDDIGKAQSGDSSAEEVIQEDRLKKRVVEQQ
jgi:hypothetical protein